MLPIYRYDVIPSDSTRKIEQSEGYPKERCDSLQGMALTNKLSAFISVTGPVFLSTTIIYKI